MKDHGELGLEIEFMDYSKLTIHPDESQSVLADLKTQIRNRANPLDRSEHWEGYEVVPGVYENAPHLEPHIYSFNKQRRVLMSRMTQDEKRDLGWTA